MTESESLRAELAEAATDQLTRLLGAGWHVSVEDQQLVLLSADGERASRKLLVRETFTPRVVRDQVSTIVGMLRGSEFRLMVLARSLTSRSKAALTEAGVDYLDLAGNVHLRNASPAIVIEKTGTAVSSRTTSTKNDSATLAGSKAARLVRVLVDFAPPYRSKALAAATELSPPYVSRLLKTLADQLIVQRESQVITGVDWPALLRSRADVYDLLNHNPATRMLAPNGIADALAALSRLPEPWAITGHYAAREVAPLASGGQLMVYLPAAADPVVLGEDLGLLQVTDAHPDVLLLRAHDPIVFDRSRQIGSHRHVALSQLVLDTLSGPGRLPAEGEAVLEHMRETESSWRAASLSPPPTD